MAVRHTTGLCHRAALVLALVALALGCTNGSAPGAAPETPRGAEQPPAAGTAVTSGQAAAPGVDADTEPTARVTLMPPGRDPVSVRVEIAQTPEERRRGLMFRKHMDADAGMFFIFDEPAPLSFWMRNTYIPLDMIFVEADLRVLGVVENAEPMTDTSRAVAGVSQYVLEVNAGFSREHGVEAGTQLKLEGVELP